MRRLGRSGGEKMKINKYDKTLAALIGIATWTALVAEVIMNGVTTWGMMFASFTALLIGLYCFSEVKE